MSSQSAQQQLPGTTRVIGTYECGYGRTHQLPSDSVRLFKCGGAGFVGYCDCGPGDLDEAHEKPHILGAHVQLLGGVGYDEAFWLQLEKIAEWGWVEKRTTDDDTDRMTAYEKREQRKREYEQAVASGGGPGAD